MAALNDIFLQNKKQSNKKIECACMYIPRNKCIYIFSSFFCNGNLGHSWKVASMVDYISSYDGVMALHWWSTQWAILYSSAQFSKLWLIRPNKSTGSFHFRNASLNIMRTNVLHYHCLRAMGWEGGGRDSSGGTGKAATMAMDFSNNIIG